MDMHAWQVGLYTLKFFLQWLIGGKWMAHEARSDGSKLISIKRQKKKNTYRHLMHT